VYNFLTGELMKLALIIALFLLSPFKSMAESVAHMSETDLVSMGVSSCVTAEECKAFRAAYDNAVEARIKQFKDQSCFDKINNFGRKIIRLAWGKVSTCVTQNPEFPSLVRILCDHNDVSKQYLEMVEKDTTAKNQYRKAAKEYELAKRIGDAIAIEKAEKLEKDKLALYSEMLDSPAYQAEISISLLTYNCPM
jgi:hypothetical protein